MTVRPLQTLILAAAIVTMSQAAHAQSDEDGLLDALANATVAGASRGDPAALGTLKILLELPDPWAGSVLTAVEKGDLIRRLADLRASHRGSKRSQFDEISKLIATLQGNATRTVATDADLGDIMIDVGGDGPHWVVVDGLPAEPRELLVHSESCAPDIVAFPASAALPAPPLDGAVRLSEQLLILPTSGPVALRISRGNCETSELSLQLSLGAARTNLSAITVPTRTRYPLIIDDQLTVVSLDRRSAETFSVQTERGYVYEVFAAPLFPELDPVLLRADPREPGGFLQASDDEGWELGARLDTFVGTGSVERFAVIRRDSVRGDVALFVRREPAPELQPTEATSTQVAESAPTWRRMTLPAGHWAITTADLPSGLDPMLTVFDGSSGLDLGANDDAEEGNPAARVIVHLEQAGEILIRIDSLRGDGNCTLAVSPAATPAAEKTPVLLDKPTELST